jgi:aspartate/methionine/tyrosine aminotransferase
MIYCLIDDIIKACGKIQSQMTSSASSISQYAATIALLNVQDDWMRDRVIELKSKRDLAYSLVSKIPNTSCKSSSHLSFAFSVDFDENITQFIHFPSNLMNFVDFVEIRRYFRKTLHYTTRLILE